MSSRYYSVLLPVKPYLHKFVQAKEMCPLKLDGDGLISIFIWEYIDKTSHANAQPIKKKRYEKTIFSANLELLIPIRHSDKVGNIIHPIGVGHINQFLEEYFEYCLLQYIDNNELPGARCPGYKDTYFSFAEKYNIEMEYDITYDAMKQKEFRVRKEVVMQNGDKTKAKYHGHFFNKIVPAYERGLPIVTFFYK